MKIALIAPTYLPARRANTIQVMKMAQAFTQLGEEVIVLVPGTKVHSQTPDWDELAQHYGLRQRFEIEWLSVDQRLRSYDYGWKSVRRAQNWGADLIYTRLPQAGAVASMVGKPTVLEVHDLPQGILGPWLLARFLKGRGARALVVITIALERALASKFSKPDNLPLIVAPDGVDLARYDDLPSPAGARQMLPAQLHLSASDFVVGYTGHLYTGRGVDLILEIAEQLKEITFLLVGGEPSDVARVQVETKARNLENILVTGFIPNAALPLYQAACDILLMPYQNQVSASSGGDIAHFLSPMKLFEYLACGRSILSSNLPVLQEILNTQNAVLLPPDDSAAWIAAIRDLQQHPEKRESLSIQCQKDVREYSWEARAENILKIAAN